MKTIFEKNGVEVQLTGAQSLFAGYGHQKITVSLYCEGNSEEFYATTSNMPGFDEATGLKDEDYEEYQVALYRLIENDIEEEISEWVDSLIVYNITDTREYLGDVITVSKKDFEIYDYIGGYFGVCLSCCFGANCVYGGDSACEDHYDKELIESIYDGWNGTLYWDQKHGYQIEL